MRGGAFATRVYRLAKTPLEAPRLKASGEELAEPKSAVIWRTMKMAKMFSPSELVALAGEGAFGLAYAREFSNALAAEEVGVLGIINPEAPRKEERRYRLIRTTGWP